MTPQAEAPAPTILPQDARTPGEVVAALGSGGVVRWPGVDLVSWELHGRRLTFALDMQNDPVQRNLRRGRFYEAPELEMIRQALPLGGVFVDIGANVGNHAVFVAAFLSPRRVIPVEPNPRAWRLLAANVVLNGLEDVFDLSWLGVGAGAAAEGGFGMEERQRNLGAARMLPGEGEIEVVTGDEVLAGIDPDVIKIDVEGMEMEVLAGLEQTIARARPVLLVEVDNASEPAFQDWTRKAGYKVAARHQRYRANRNYLLRPRRGWAPSGEKEDAA